jgi:hypothetical protein
MRTRLTNRPLGARSRGLLTLIGGLLLISAAAVRADTLYKIEPIFKGGDKLGNAQARSDVSILVGALNDAGQIAFFADWNLAQYADGKITSVTSLGGPWPPGLGYFWSLISMNEAGEVVFVPADFDGAPVDGNPPPIGTYLWDPKAREVTAVATKGMPVGRGLTIEAPGYTCPVINNRDELAFPSYVKNAAGGVQQGIFFRGQDHQVTPVAVPDQPLPDGTSVVRAAFPSLNDAGVIAFVVRPSNHPTGRPTAAFLWEKGAISKIAGIPADAPGGEKIGAYFRPFVNNHDGSVLLTVSLNAADPNSGPFAFYRWSAGKLAPVLVPGQEIPGGKLQTVFGGAEAASFPNDAGQQVFLARLEDGSTAAYLLDLDNSIHLVLQTGGSTELGHVTSIADDSGGGVGLNNPDIGAGLNNKGQVALPVRFDKGPWTLVLLTPAAP